MMRVDSVSPAAAAAREVIAGALRAAGGSAYFRAAGEKDDSPGATFVVGRLDPATGEVRYAAATRAEVRAIPRASMLDWKGRPCPGRKPRPEAD